MIKSLLTNLKIIGIKKPSFSSPLTALNSIPLIFETMFNPETYTTQHQTNFNFIQPLGTSGLDAQYVGTNPVRFSIEFTIDGTGVTLPVSMPVNAGAALVVAQIALFNKVTLEVDGNIHRPNYLIVQWGTFLRECVLEYSSITYTLFSAEGIPLRAKITASFVERIDKTLNAITSLFSSPDLTHVKEVNEGDLLPLMIYETYNDQQYYLQVARANKLKNFRKLKTGTSIILPPIE